MNEVAITGIGVILPGCDKRADLWRQLRSADSQLTLERSPAGEDEQCPMGRVAGFDPDGYMSEFPARFYRSCPRETQMYLAATVLAWGDAGLDLFAGAIGSGRAVRRHIARELRVLVRADPGGDRRLGGGVV